MAEGARPIRSAAMPNPMRPTTESSPVSPKIEATNRRGKPWSTAKATWCVTTEKTARGVQRYAKKSAQNARVRSASPISAPQVRAPALAPRAGAAHAGALPHAQPDEGQQHGERAHAQGEIGGAPAVSGDQPLGERTHRQHAGAHARERHAHRAATPLGEPPRDQRPAGIQLTAHAPAAVSPPTIR